MEKSAILLYEQKYFSNLLGPKIQITLTKNGRGILKIPFNSKKELIQLKKIIRK